MTALTDFCDELRQWLNYDEAEYDNDLVTSFIRDAETTLSTTLRVKHMLQIDTAVLSEDRVLLPSDWVEMDLVRVVGGVTLAFRIRDEFYNNKEDDDNYNSGYYTVSGNYLIVGPGVTDGATLELHYFQDIPTMTDPATWLKTKYPALFRFAAMVSAENYGRDFESASGWLSQVNAIVEQLNSEYKASKTPQGQALKPRRSQGFG